MRLVFMGTPNFSVPTLEALVAAGHEVCAVYTQPPSRAGRGKKERVSAVQQAAQSLDIPVHTPISFRDPTVISGLIGLRADMAVVIAYGQILPQEALDAPEYGCINVHASLLPRWRGAAPIHRAIMAGDAETGVDIMVMEAGLDTGPVIAEATVEITDEMTTGILHDQLARMGADLISDAIEGYVKGDIKPNTQSSEGVTYAKKIDKAEAKIDWSQDARSIFNLVRGLNPFPGAWCMMNGERVKILAGQMVDKNGAVGAVLDEQLTIACGDGAYQILSLQRAGKGPVSAADYLLGHSIPAGSRL